MVVEHIHSRSWWYNGVRRYDDVELVADAVVHGIGIAVAVCAGGVLLVYAGLLTAPEHFGSLLFYTGSMLCVLLASLAFNQCPIGPRKRSLAKIDQAAIFLFIAGSYTPFLSFLGDHGMARPLLYGIWGIALMGIVLKLFVPERFGRIAVVLYLALGWSGMLVYDEFGGRVPELALVLVVLGGLAYTGGVVFHLWERLRFHNVLWHVAVVLGASLHLAAVFDCMVISRLQ